MASNPLPSVKTDLEAHVRSGGSAKADKERRRQSWNDFVIPRNVLEKQKEVRRGIEGVKRFAGGVEGKFPARGASSSFSFEIVDYHTCRIIVPPLPIS
jgi:hypothetical protein